MGGRKGDGWCEVMGDWAGKGFLWGGGCEWGWGVTCSRVWG